MPLKLKLVLKAAGLFLSFGWPNLKRLTRVIYRASNDLWDSMKAKLMQACLLLTLFGLILITPIGRAQNTEWNLQVTNLAGTNTVTYTYNQLLAMPETTVTADLSCDGSLVASGDWEGVSLSYLLQQLGVDPAVASVDFQASDGYITNIPLLEAMQPNVIIAYQLDGESLPETLRLVLPGENGNVWIDMITSIIMSSTIIPYAAGGGIVGTPPTFSTGQATTQQQGTPQPQPTATPKSETSTKPITAPANVTQAAPKSTPLQSSSPQSLILSSPFVVAYGIAIGITIALAAAGYLIYRGKRGKAVLVS